MGFVQREADLIRAAILAGAVNDAELRAAQQALMWATDPQTYASPSATLIDSLKNTKPGARPD